MIDYVGKLASAIDKFSGSVSNDEVFILDPESLTQVFPSARMLNGKVIENGKIAKHPLEDGSTITDHRFSENIQIEISMAYIGSYKDTLEEIRSAFSSGKLYSIFLKGRTYENMVLTEIPHDEDPEFIDALMASIRFEEARFVTPEEGELPERKVENKKDASTTKRGTQQTSAPTSSQEAKAADVQSKGSGSLLSRATGIGQP